MKVAIIPARGGSVRVPRKNIKIFHGRPILHYTLDTVRASLLFDRVIVSTDDDQIADVARAGGAEVMMRPDGFDACGTQDIGALVVDRLSDKNTVPHYACVIYPTLPLMAAEDLKAGWTTMNDRHPIFAFAVGASPLRDAGMFYWGEGWAFVARISLISPRSCMVAIPDERICDINEPGDWARAEAMYLVNQEKACAAS